LKELSLLVRATRAGLKGILLRVRGLLGLLELLMAIESGRIVHLIEMISSNFKL
jgi:hypothetical protein